MFGRVLRRVRQATDDEKRFQPRGSGGWNRSRDAETLRFMQKIRIISGALSLANRHDMPVTRSCRERLLWITVGMRAGPARDRRA
jgi:hypothetical protein